MLGQWNAAGLNILRNMNIHNMQAMRSMERLSSGMRINRAGDDPAGLAISEKMRGQIRGLAMAQRNIQDSISLFQTAEGALNETHDMLQRMRELSVQAASDTLTDNDRKQISLEFEELKKEIQRTATDTQFNTMPLLDGSRNSFKTQAGANAGQFIEFSIGDMRTAELGISEASIGTREDADKAIGLLDKAISNVSSERSKMGAYMNRLEHAYSNAQTMEMNLTAAESRIRDADIAKEMMALTKANILLQAGQYVLSLHMQQAQSVLQLLRQ
ncbi:flagellin N-terminal helical domain-containing protein [Sporosarcina cascadiensis]|uniref:flagellin N-terminal helical domain-containing protein n=1 Tax=Sporosarcina cascadiensis TaxID=2660747 RepID=UPI00129BE9BF|nr:flagellin [Sporosarcina cascadiensis]